MAVKLETPHMGSIPPHARHAITVHMPGWSSLLKFIDRDMELMMSFTSMYPRMMLHKDIKELTKIILGKFGAEGQNCLIFSSSQTAAECVAYATSELRKDDVLKEDEISIKAFDVHVRLWAVFFPAPKTPIIHAFWMNAGVGISSRLGEEAVKNTSLLKEVTDDSPAPKYELNASHAKIQERIAGLLERSLVGPSRKAKVSPDDVYLFQTGMASIYGVHQMLLSLFSGSTVLFGFAFHSTIHIFEDWPCPGFKFFGNGDTRDTDALEAYLESETKEGRKVQAVWAEFPSNPILVTADLKRLRSLADKYGFALIIDDTIGSFCNVDVLSAADIIVTSLTKSFSGYADVMGASAVLNPSSSLYPQLKSLFRTKYTNYFYNADADTMESNSRNYLERSATMNANAEALTSFLQQKAEDPSSSVAKVYYPTQLPSLSLYRPYMRPATPDFTPGYGCLFSVEFTTMEATQAFYEALNVHIGPHLGAHLTLALPYVRALYASQLEWASEFDLRPTQVRVSTGLEDTRELVETFRVAVEAADGAKVDPTVVVAALD